MDIPGSKSITNRAMILAALNEKETLLKNMLFSDDTLYMIDALQKLGNELIVDKEAKTVPPYKYEIEMLKSKKNDAELLNKIRQQ